MSEFDSLDRRDDEEAPWPSARWLIACVLGAFGLAWLLTHDGALQALIGVVAVNNPQRTGREALTRALRTDIEPWHLPHMGNKPNDAPTQKAARVITPSRPWWKRLLGIRN